MSHSNPDAFQVRQVYRREDVLRIFGVGEGQYRRHEGDRFPRRMTPSLTVLPLWSKAEVWLHLDLDWPTIELPTGDFVSSLQLGGYLSLNDHTITRLAGEGTIPGSRLGPRWLFAADYLRTLFGHVPLIWPKRADDPAFSAVKESATPVQTAMNGHAPDPLTPVALDEETVRRIVREEMRAVIAVIRSVAIPTSSLRERVNGFNVNSDPIGVNTN